MSGDTLPPHGGPDSDTSDPPSGPSHHITSLDASQELSALPSEDSLDASDTDSDSDEEVDESLATTIIQEIEDGTYVCLVCTCEVDRHLEIWTCKQCYRVYDLECIEDWAQRGSSTTQNKRWRCPACNYEHSQIPKQTTCWCGRISKPSPDSLIPFSCGSTCGAKYDNCVHACSNVCHPGKHPECGALGPVMDCRCGKHSQQLPCIITPYAAGWKCQDPCTTVVCPLGHTCPQKGCHLGFCGQCTEQVEVRCYCGKTHRQVPCLEIAPKKCHDGDAEFLGGVACDSVVIQYYDCNAHFEELPCMPLPLAPPPCKYSPELVRTCYCGKTAANAARSKCTDPMPECDQVCGKQLKCGCTCRTKCHSGPCICYNIIDLPCACGHASFSVPCKAVQQGFVPHCRHKCSAMLSCRKHFHREECCDQEQEALKRERENKKLLRNRVKTNFDDQILTMEPAHICTRTCGQMKLCGKHTCEALCHSGTCPVCLESSTEDLVCHCGKTVVPAPVRCGTKIECQEQCVRQPPCGHRPEPHRCHGDDKNCPNCSVIVSRMCNCGSKEVKTVLCWSPSASCGKLCSVKKECGHACNRPCSRECTDGHHAPTASCQSLCRKIRQLCPHMCAGKCHYAAGTKCDSKRCKENVKVTCPCGRLTRVTVCGASLTELSKIGTHIACDDDCAQAKREEELRLVFNMAPSHFDNPYPEEVTGVFKRQVAWCLKFETMMRTFISNYEDCVAAEITARKSLHFPPMTKPQRRFIHELAQVYKLYSESQDKEPMRSVFICITDRTAVPAMTIKQALDKQDDLERRKQQLEELKQSQIDGALFNAILIQDVFFGVSKEDVEGNVKELLEGYPEIGEYVIQWMKESTFVFYSAYFSEMDREKEDKLYILLKTFKKVLREKLIAFDCKMCMVDDGLTYVLKVDLVNVVATSGPDPVKSSQNAFDLLQESVDVES